MDNKKYHLNHHLEELRKRIIYVLVMLVTTIIIGFIFASDIIHHFSNAYLKNHQSSLNVFNPMSAIMLYMKVSLVFALVFMFPFVFYQIWKFVGPGLTHQERKITKYYIPFSGILFLLGLLFGYKLVFPFLFDFVISFADNLGFQQVIGAEEYFRTLFNLVVPLALFFELPVIVLFLTHLRILTPKRLAKMRKVSYLSLVILAGLFTPPDFLSQIIVSAPLIILFEISILLSSIIYRKQHREDEAFMIGSTE